MGHTKIPIQIAFGVLAFLMSHDHDRRSFKSGEAADDCGIIAVTSITVQLDKILEAVFQIIQRCWAKGMAGNLYPLPAGKSLINILLQFLELFL